MKAWLIANHFLNGNKFSELTNWLFQAAKAAGIEMELKTNAGCLAILGRGGVEAFKQSQKTLPEFVLFWDKDVRLAAYLETLGIPVYNSSKSIALCDDKSMTHLTLEQYGIPMPKTILAPMTFENIGYTDYDFLSMVGHELRYPLVIKECFGSFGAQVYLAKDENELLVKVKRIGTKPMLFQEFIKSSEGRDIRLQVVGDQVVASMYRYSEIDFRANISSGGKMKAYQPTDKQIALALECTKRLGLTFAGVDLLFDEHEEPIVCEVNSNAHFKNIFDCTGVDTAKKIIDYILLEERNHRC
ncbi:ATP-grasp domain-containing protein [Lachnoclostridium phytofermentans]|uniref:Alpha-L-glutamate ligase, RimK family n=1 Tax=Lachnoclostridium phytofermentans (strain ATCC 700394 / DSM 18823 / ISDg) TaxID=357809 RepID=A9KNJ7_LACP7|nr:RimK family alpha-L-glutamate ligase [Lachnoclostridium phytofermentans]ABX43114.1 alpha-L-glutamate ligase, RimK family [Lachnoclostridium phytofermentans ISDg]